MATYVSRLSISIYISINSDSDRAVSKDLELENTYIKLLRETSTHEKSITRDLGRYVSCLTIVSGTCPHLIEGHSHTMPSSQMDMG